MSVTFFMPEHQQTCRCANPSYNPEEPEDPIYNPKEIDEDVYPSVNLANLNAGMLLRKLNLYTEELYGEIPPADIDSFILLLRGLSTSDPIDENCKRITSYVNRLLLLAITARSLKDGISWA